MNNENNSMQLMHILSKHSVLVPIHRNLIYIVAVSVPFVYFLFLKARFQRNDTIVISPKTHGLWK